MAQAFSTTLPKVFSMGDNAPATLDLLVAVHTLDPDRVRQALNEGGNPDALIGVEGKWPRPLLMHLADARGHQASAPARTGPIHQMDALTIVGLLLDAGARPGLPAPNGETAWHLALLNQDNALVKTLLAVSDEGINARRSQDNLTPLLALAGDLRTTTGVPPVAERLLRAGANPSLAGPRGSVLHTAMARCEGKSGDVRNLKAWTRVLLDAGLDLGVTDQNGSTVMHWIARHGRLDLAQTVWSTPEPGRWMALTDQHGRTPWELLSYRHRATWEQAWLQRERRALLNGLDEDTEVPAPVASRPPRRL